jgi:putative chitinase
MKLNIGSKGEEVKKLQERLGLSPDGDFGKITEDKVKSWQKENGLEPDGIVGEITWNKLFSQEIKNDVLGLNKLRGVIPNEILLQIPDTASKFNITTTLRLAHFLSQCATESGEFKKTSENLNYSSQGLKKNFGKYFPGNLNESYANKPEKIANRVYGSRMGNGGEESGEGWKYRGRSYIQLTGKSNYEKFDKFVSDDIVKNPDLVASKYPLMAAGWFFDSNQLWKICDLGSSHDVVEKLTRKINGGINGLEERKNYFTKFYNLLKK